MSAIVLAPQQGQVFRTNETGRTILQLCDGAHTPDAIAAQLAAEFRATLHEARRDTAAYLAELARLGLLDESPPLNGL